MRRRRNSNAAGVGARGVVDNVVVALHTKSTTARRRHKQRPRRLPPGLLSALDAVNGRMPPMTRLERMSFARQLALVRRHDEQRRRDRGYPHP
jgi:hypothetical protein